MTSEEMSKWLLDLASKLPTDSDEEELQMEDTLSAAAAALRERDRLAVENALLKETIAPIVTCHIHSGVARSWEIYLAFVAGGTISSITVDQLLMAQDALTTPATDAAVERIERRGAVRELRRLADDMFESELPGSLGIRARADELEKL
jgi:hypothetical protein